MHLKSLLKTNALIIIALLAVSFSAFAQAPNLLNYQGVARNAVGNPLPNQTMKLRLSVHDLLPSGAVVYSEIRQITTNLGGLFSVQIGSAGASSSTGTLGGVNWIVGNKFLQVELDPASNNNYLDIGTVQLVSVPYAFGAGSAATVKTNANLTGVVTSVGNQTSIANGAISSDMIGTLNQSKVGLGSVNNTSDAAKPISTLTQAALDLKANVSDVTSALDNKVDKVVGKNLSTNDYTTDEKTKLSTISGINTGDQDLSLYATTTSLSNSLASKVDKVNGKDLSTNDFTNTEKNKLASITGTNTGDQINITGNAATASKLATTKNINGIPFDGSADITISAIANAGTLTGTTLNSTVTASSLTSVGTISSGTISLTTNIKTSGTITAGAVTYPSTHGTSGQVLSTTGSGTLTWTTASGGGVSSIGAISGSSTANGGGITAGVLNLAPADATNGGIVTTGNQTFAGAKIFTDNIQVNSIRIGAPSSGSANTMLGAYSLLYGAPGSNNTAVGTMSLASITNSNNGGSPGGNDNTAVGTNAIRQGGAANGNRNTAVGSAALSNGSAPSDNTALGYSTLPNVTGGSNTAVGSYALLTNTSGTNNTAIGYGADVSSGTLSNSTAIGGGAIVTASNTIQLGNTSVTNVNTSGTLTARTVTYPNTHGTSGQVLSTTGSGTLTWTTVSGGGSQWTSSSNNIYYSTGNVGIGTNSPSSKLHLVGAGASDDRNNMLRIESNNNASLTLKNTNANAGGGEYQLFTSSSNSNPSLGAGSLAIYYDHPSAAAYRFSINTAGNVGIGTGMPTEKLDVLGNVKTSGTLTAGTVTYPNIQGTTGQVLTSLGSGTLSWTTVSYAEKVPYTGATGAVNLGAYDLTVNEVKVGKGLANIADNTAVGINALNAASTSGGGNSAFGYQALQANTTGGSSNSAFGYKALTANTTGYSNTAIGANSLLNNTTGYNNISVNGALVFNTTGNYNIGIGLGALQGNKFGNTNIAIGREAGYNLNGFNYSSGTGSGNIFIGYQAGISRNIGSNNTAIGHQSLYSYTVDNYNYSNTAAFGIQSGFNNRTNNNTFLGSLTDVDYSINSSITNATALGYQATVSASNTIQLGNTSVTNVKTSGTITAAALEVTGNVTSTTGSISGFDAALNNQTGTTYTLTSSDNGKVVTLNNSSPITLTINTGLGDGFNCLIVQKGAGQITMAGNATRINRQSHTKTAGQYAVVSIVNIGSETIIVAGDTGS